MNSVTIIIISPLPTSTLMKKIDPYISNHESVEICSICRTRETIKHILFECFYAKEIWYLFCHKLKVWNKNGKINWHDILFCNFKLKFDCKLLSSRRKVLATPKVTAISYHW